MHDAWYIDHIRDIIFLQLSADSLFNLSQTCRVLSYSATSALWCHHATCEAFISCLPEDCQERKLVRNDLQRLVTYMSKVTRIAWDSRDGSKPLSVPRRFREIPIRRSAFEFDRSDSTFRHCKKTWVHLWTEIMALIPGVKLFPNLRRLRLHQVQGDLLMPISLCRPLELTHLYVKTVHGDMSRDHIQKLLSCLSSARLEYVYVRESDLVPQELLQEASLKTLRLEKRHGRMGHADMDPALWHAILEKRSIKSLSTCLSKSWFSCGTLYACSATKILPCLNDLWLDLAGLSSPCSEECPSSGRHTWYHHSVPPADQFFENLDNPSLFRLSIRFPYLTTDSMLLVINRAIARGCSLEKLTRLEMTAPWDHERFYFRDHSPPVPETNLSTFREALTGLFPLPSLKFLHFSLGSCFLDVLDLPLYTFCAVNMPLLETLWLGSSNKNSSTLPFEGWKYCDRSPLTHAAAFCSMFAHLRELSLGACDARLLDGSLEGQWICPTVSKLEISTCSPRQANMSKTKAQIDRHIQFYFPYSDLATDGGISEVLSRDAELYWLA